VAHHRAAIDGVARGVEHESWEKIVAAWDDSEARPSRVAAMVESVIFLAFIFRFLE
jgi:hypothetical protein